MSINESLFCSVFATLLFNHKPSDWVVTRCWKSALCAVPQYSKMVILRKWLNGSLVECPLEVCWFPLLSVLNLFSRTKNQHTPLSSNLNSNISHRSSLSRPFPRFYSENFAFWMTQNRRHWKICNFLLVIITLSLCTHTDIDAKMKLEGCSPQNHHDR